MTIMTTPQAILDAISQVNVADLETQLQDLLGQVAATRRLIELARARNPEGRKRVTKPRKPRNEKPALAAVGNNEHTE